MHAVNASFALEWRYGTTGSDSQERNLQHEQIR
jgi:hypothetical protein